MSDKMTITHGSSEYKKALEEAKSHLVLDPPDGHVCSSSLQFARALLAAEEKIQELGNEYAVVCHFKEESENLSAKLAKTIKALEYYQHDDQIGKRARDVLKEIREI